MINSPALLTLEGWFQANGWQEFEFQRATWDAYLAGKSGLVHAPTGSGKTLAVFGGPVLERLREPRAMAGLKLKRNETEPFRLIWITPMRALASDTTHALQNVVKALGLNWSVELRTS
ncbi:MAG: DEAD/DEAH box helicase, partial [Tepidisphaeraceae bacterium]